MTAVRDTRVLVTGADGFIGSHLTRRLAAEGAHVHALTPSVSSFYPPRLLDLRDAISLHEGNLMDRSAMEILAKRVRPDLIFHLGAYTHVGKSWERIDECIQVNVQGTANILQSLDGVGYTRFVNVGTSEIYGGIDVPFREDASVRPESPYAISKYAAEQFCRIFAEGYGWPIVMVRPFNAYGPAQSPDRIIPEVIAKALRGADLQLTTGAQTREFNYVDDIVDGLILAGTRAGIEGELFNVGCEHEIAIRDLVTTILELLGNPIEPGFGKLPDRPNEILRMYSDSSKAKERLGWKSERSLQQGLNKTIDWYRSELEEGSSSSFDP